MTEELGAEFRDARGDLRLAESEATIAPYDWWTALRLYTEHLGVLERGAAEHAATQLEAMRLRRETWNALEPIINSVLVELDMRRGDPLEHLCRLIRTIQVARWAR